MILTDAEIAAITERERPKAQAKVLDALGVPYRPRPDGSLVVSRAAAQAALGGPIGPTDDEPEDYAVDVEALRRHGKATAAH
jgi:hypothetical protein